jgi:hypothetical protein
MLVQIKNKYIAIFIMMVCLLNCNYSNAQSATPQQIMASIYRAYDSLNYLSFNIKYTYTSDTVNGNFTHDMLEGAYTIASKKAKFNLGDIEFMQNDSFFITVYNDDKYILVADPRNENTGSELPMRQTIDSIVGSYQLHYDYTVSTVATDTTNNSDTTAEVKDTTVLAFTKADSLAQFEKFIITYDNVNKVLHSIRYVFLEPVALEYDTLAPGAPAPSSILPISSFTTKQLKIEFSRYRFDNFSESVYDEEQYIFFEDEVCKPISKYKDYRIFYSRLGVTNTVEPPNPQ